MPHICEREATRERYEKEDGVRRRKKTRKGGGERRERERRGEER